MFKKYYPLALRLENKNILVVGGGRIAERKILGLLSVQAKICVVSPNLTSRLQLFVRGGRINWLARKVKRSDLQGKDFIIAATSDKNLNHQVSSWSKASGAWVNVVDDSEYSNYICPAILRKEQGIITVYTQARNPRLSRDLKNYLKEHWDEFLSYRHRLQKHLP